jgi:hypothetical protein
MANSPSEWEEGIAKVTLFGTNLTAPTTIFIGCSTLKPSEVTKKTTSKQFGEAEPTEGNGWKRIELNKEEGEWEKSLAEGESGKTKYTYKKEVKFEKLTGGEYLLETFGVFEKAKASESGKFLGYGKMEPKATINSGAELKIEAKKLVVEFEVA